MIQLHLSYVYFQFHFDLLFQAFPYHAGVSISSSNLKYIETSLVFHLFPSILSNNHSKWTLIDFFPLRQHQQPKKRQHLVFTQIIKICLNKLENVQKIIQSKSFNQNRLKWRKSLLWQYSHSCCCTFHQGHGACLCTKLSTTCDRSMIQRVAQSGNLPHRHRRETADRCCAEAPEKGTLRKMWPFQTQRSPLGNGWMFFSFVFDTH